MRNSIKVLIIVASILIGTGIVFSVGGFFLGGFEILFKENRKSEYTMMSASFSDVKNINIADVSNNVNIIRAEGDEVKVTYAHSSDFTYKSRISTEHKTLTVIFEDYRKWNDFIFSIENYEETELTIEVPEAVLDSLQVTCTSGDVTVSDLNSKSTRITTTSGDIHLGGNVGELEAKTTSGRVELDAYTEATSAYVKSTSGRLSLSGNLGEKLEAYANSGKVEGYDVKADVATVNTTSGKVEVVNGSFDALNVEATSGKVEMDNVICKNDMNIETTSGGIDIDNADALNYNLKSTSGSIRADILHHKWYQVNTTSGRIDIPENHYGADAKGIFNAKTTSGNVNVEVDD